MNSSGASVRDSNRKGGRPGRARLAATLLGAVLGAGLGLATAASAAAPSSVTVPVPPQKVRTDTGIALRKGDAVTITASGHIHFGGGKIAAMTPDGIAWGNECNAIARGNARNSPWPTPGFRCWSLVGRVGDGPPFGIGTQKSLVAQRAGELFLVINDNHVQDNTGAWSATIVVTPAGAATAPGAPGKKHSDTSTYVLLGAVALGLVLLVGLVQVGARRRRDRRAAALDATLVSAVAAAAPAPAFTPPPPPAAPAAWPDEPAPVVEATPDAPPEADSIDVNIFEVEFSNGLTLRVGYNHFPEGTPLRWRVTQNRVPVATGQFVTKGGGSTNHVETFPLGVKLEGRNVHPDGADVQFDWSINGVPFRYSVRRDPNC